MRVIRSIVIREKPDSKGPRIRSRRVYRTFIGMFETIPL